MSTRFPVGLHFCAFALLACSEGEGQRCDVDTSGYERGEWSEPGTKWLDMPIEATRASNVWLEDVSFGSDIHRTRSVVWWPMERDALSLTYRWAPGSNIGLFRDARLVALVDGVQIPLLDADGEEVWYLPVSVEPGELGGIVTRIGGKAMDSGAHSFVLTVLSANSGAVISGAIFTVIRDEAKFEPGRDDKDLLRIVPRERFLQVTSGDKPVPFGRALETVEADGSLPLEFRLQSPAGLDCPGLHIPVIATVLIDFRQVEMRDLGLFVRADLELSEGAIIRTQVNGPPPGDSRHVFTVLHYSGDGLFTEAPPGSFTPWSEFQPSDTGFGFY